MTTKDLTGEERLVWINCYYLDMLVRISRAVEERYGTEAREVINEALYETGRDMGMKLRHHLGITGKEPMDYARLLMWQDRNLFAVKEEITPGDSGAVIVRVTYCPAIEVPGRRACAMGLAGVRGMIEVLNPDLKWKSNKLLTKGDDCCEFVVTKD